MIRIILFCVIKGVDLEYFVYAHSAWFKNSLLFHFPNMSHLYTVHTNVNAYYESYKSQFRSKYHKIPNSPEKSLFG